MPPDTTRQALHVPTSLRLALCQFNPTVGDLEGNARRILEETESAKAQGADVVAFTELAIPGYPPEDLLIKPGFLRENGRALHEIARGTHGIVSVVGFVDVAEDVYNAAAVIAEGEIRGIYHKFYLPTYGVFDEDRYFQRGDRYPVFDLQGVRLGVTICEDIWYPRGPAATLALLGGADVVININASPFHAGKWRFREAMLTTRASDCACALAYVNQVGGQDELVFDGHSLVIDANGDVIARGAAFESALLTLDIDLSAILHRRLADPRRRKEKLLMQELNQRVEVVPLPALPANRRRPALPAPVQPPPEPLAEIYRALLTGTRDYVRKNGFKGVVIGISGGIDSALVATVAVDALGAEAVTLVSMPSVYTSSETRSDAASVAQNLGTRFLEIPIRGLQTAYDEALRDVFAGLPRDITEENIQARARGNILMALSNKFGWLVLTTGNKSEMACGYATLYGDMAGGFAVIKDVPKTTVYQLAEYRNRIRPVIPESIIRRPPSAELRHGQKDSDTLPPYDVLDPILHAYVEEDRSLEDIVRAGFDADLVRRVILMVDRNEYKRRQAPPGIKITPKAFGKDRRLPITNQFHDVNGP
ncbi:MAG: NAD+ synthase [Armatimonadetes bacterium]|nr:NAD+ synthase [Armatimonadota bacterium]